MIALFVIVAIIILFWYLNKPIGYCVRCKRTLSIIQAWRNAKLVNKEVVCSKCLSNTPTSNSIDIGTITPHKKE
jgi:predicted Fe-S protein YdhL (DUF1289 family)